MRDVRSLSDLPHQLFDIRRFLFAGIVAERRLQLLLGSKYGTIQRRAAIPPALHAHAPSGDHFT